MSLTVLVIDDSKSSRKLNLAYVHDLLGPDITALEAPGGAQGLDILQSRPVDVVLLDLTMPEMSGYEVLGEIQRLGLTPHIIVISADIQRRTQERVAALGASGFLGKPVECAALGALLDKIREA